MHTHDALTQRRGGRRRKKNYFLFFFRPVLGIVGERIRTVIMTFLSPNSPVFFSFFSSYQRVREWTGEKHKEWEREKKKELKKSHATHNKEKWETFQMS
jgi:hypothetical protein